MDLIWIAFLLGFVGSLHCGVMCGPLVIALAGTGGSGLSFAASRLVYNAGRIATYVAIGLLFGGFGNTFVLAGVQRWVSLIAGAAILLGMLVSSRFAVTSLVARYVVLLKSSLGGLLQRRTPASQFMLGMLNGLLPCGLVYIAAAAAAATLSPLRGALHMAAFGVGTLPMMLGIGVASGRLRFVALRFQKLVPVCILLVGVLLLLRGTDLGIPYLSPRLSDPAHPACH